MIAIQDHRNRIFLMPFCVAMFILFTLMYITDIYACIVNLVEHSYGYDSTEILLTDTQVVHLMAPLTDGDYDTDFDGRNDDFDIHKPLENRQSGKMSTLNYDEVNLDYSQDYRYFFMPSTQYYYELSEMSMVLANMVNKKSGINRRWNKDTLYVTKIVNDSGAIETESYRERYNL